MFIFICPTKLSHPFFPLEANHTLQEKHSIFYYNSQYTEEQFKKWIQTTVSSTHKHVSELLVEVLNIFKSRPLSWRKFHRGRTQVFFKGLWAALMCPRWVTDFRSTGTLWDLGAFVWGCGELYFAVLFAVVKNLTSGFGTTVLGLFSPGESLFPSLPLVWFLASSLGT